LNGCAVLGLVLTGVLSAPAAAWDRGEVGNLGTIPVFTPSGPGAACPGGTKSCTSDIEGVAVGPDGTVYTPSFGFNSQGALGGYGELFVFAPSGELVRHFPVTGSSPHLIGMVYQGTSNSVLIADLGSGNVWKVDPRTQVTSLFMAAPHSNDLAWPQCADDRQSRQRLCVRFLPRRHLEDRTRRRHARGVVFSRQSE
jgi:hypothetical protein